MNISQDILSGISKGLNISIMMIKDGFLTNQLKTIPVSDYINNNNQR